MTIITGLGQIFREELALGIHVFAEGSPSDTIMLALYGPNASLYPSLDAYTTAGEVSGGGYSAGGVAVPLTIVGASGSGRGDGAQFEHPYINPTANTSIAVSGVGVRGCMLYNASKSNRNIFTLDFGATLTPSTGILLQWGLLNVTALTDALIPLVGNQV